MSPFERLLKETHRRGLWKVLVVFAGGGWGVLGVLDTLIGYGYVPEWVFGGGLLVLLVGLPVVSATAWVQGGRSVRPAATAGDPEDEAILESVEAAGASRAGGGSEEDTTDHLFTWPRAITGGVLAFALLGVLTAGYMFMRATGIGAPGTLVAQGVLEEGAEIVLADFASTAGEAAPGPLLTESLRIDLAQSDAFRLVPERITEEALERMLLGASVDLTEDVALEVAERIGATAVISGEVGRVGSDFVITARVISVASGDPLASFRVAADGEDRLLGAMDELSRSLRDKIGESLQSLARTESLASVTTSSLDALRKYTTASNQARRGLITASVEQQLYQEAVALDSAFAWAHSALAISINNLGGDRELMNRSYAAAWRHRERLTERERLIIEAHYYKNTGDRAEAARSYRALLAVDPGDHTAATNLADVLMYEGEYAEVVELSRSAPNWDEGAWAFNYSVALSGLGQLEAALAVSDTFLTYVTDNPYDATVRALTYTAHERPADALAVLAAAPPNPDPLAAAYESYAAAVATLSAGSMAAGREHLATTVQLVGRATGPSDQILRGLAGPWVRAVVEGEPARARAEIEELARMADRERLSPYNRAHELFALTYAVAGLADEARAELARFDAEVAAEATSAMRGQADVARAILALHADEAGALDRFDRALPALECQRCADLLYGLVHEAAGDGSSAIARYERYVNEPFFDAGNFLMHVFAAAVHERLGMLHDQAGDTAQAAEHYRRFAALWADAEPELQPRVRRARERAAALGG
jgi:tetratricopeptide (TPR) repeat protein